MAESRRKWPFVEPVSNWVDSTQSGDCLRAGDGQLTAACDTASRWPGEGSNSFSMAISRRRELSAGLITPRLRSKWPFMYPRRQLEMTERLPNL
jgi:hypothetical protein